jgi:hypothetical protein
MSDDPEVVPILEGYNINLELQAFVRAHIWQGFLSIEFIPFGHKKARFLMKALNKHLEKSNEEQGGEAK